MLEAGVGALARLYEEQVGPELRTNLNRTFLETYSLKSRETDAIDQMQREVRKSYFHCFTNTIWCLPTTITIFHFYSIQKVCSNFLNLKVKSARLK